MAKSLNSEFKINVIEKSKTRYLYLQRLKLFDVKNRYRFRVGCLTLFFNFSNRIQKSLYKALYVLVGMLAVQCNRIKFDY